MQSFTDTSIYTEIKVSYMDLEKLVERAKEGDAEAFGKLYSLYVDKMKGVSIRILRERRDDAPDLVHDAFIVAFASIGKLRDPRRFGEWLTTITSNLTLRYLEKCRSEHTVSLSPFQESDLDVADSPEVQDEQISADYLLSLIDRLPEGYRKVFHLSVIEGLSHKEVAEMLNIEPHSSSSQLARAKAMLRRMLADRRYLAVVMLAIFIVSVYRYTKRYWGTRIEESHEFAGQQNLAGREDDISEYISDTLHVVHGDTHASDDGRIVSQVQEQMPAVYDSDVIPCDDALPAVEADFNYSHLKKPQIMRYDINTDVRLPQSEYIHIAEDKASFMDRSFWKRKWKMLLAGSSGPMLAQNVYRLVKTGASDVGSGSPSYPEYVSTWEEYYRYLSELSHDDMPADSATLINIAKNNSGKIEEQENHQKPITIGLSFTKSLGERWSFETGLQYTLLRSSFVMGSGMNNISREQKVHYLGIPLRLSYRFADYKRFSAYCSAGVNINIPIGGTSEQKLLTDSVSMDIGSTRVKAPFQWSVNAGVGLQYRFTKNFSLYAEPTINYYIPSGSSVHTIWTERPFSFTVPFGIRFSW